MRKQYEHNTGQFEQPSLSVSSKSTVAASYDARSTYDVASSRLAIYGRSSRSASGNAASAVPAYQPDDASNAAASARPISAVSFGSRLLILRPQSIKVKIIQ